MTYRRRILIGAVWKLIENKQGEEHRKKVKVQKESNTTQTGRQRKLEEVMPPPSTLVDGLKTNKRARSENQPYLCIKPS